MLARRLLPGERCGGYLQERPADDALLEKGEQSSSRDLFEPGANNPGRRIGRSAAHRIGCPSVYPDFIMDMRASGSPARADQPDDITLVDRTSGFDIDRGHMRVPCFDAVSVVQGHHIPVIARPAGALHRSTLRGPDRRASRSSKIDARMKSGGSMYRIRPPAKGAGQASARGQEGR